MAPGTHIGAAHPVSGGGPQADPRTDVLIEAVASSKAVISSSFPHAVDALTTSVDIFATLADRLRRGEAVAKSLIFLPMAISFVGAAVVGVSLVVNDVVGALTVWTELSTVPRATHVALSALIWAAARAVPSSAVYSFDPRFPAEGIELRQP